MVNIPGKALFVANGGQILHSSERRSDDIFVGKRVLVVGNGKSAVDAAVAAAVVAEENGTAPPIQMARRQTWYVPRYILGLIQYKWVFHTRLGCSLLPAYYETSKFWKAIHYVLSPLKWMTWRIVELLLLCQYHLPPRLWPKLRTIEGATLDNSVLITDNKHLRRLRKKQVDMRIGEVSSLKPGKAVLNNGEEEDVDVIIMATGWSLGFDLFMDSDFILAGLDFKGGLDFNQDGLWCYRNILPTEFKGLAFVGSNSLTFMNIYTAYIQSYWLAQLLAGVRSWPKEEQMKMTVDREKKWKRTLYTHCNDMRGASIEAYMQHYHDVLFREMNASEPFNCLIRPVANLIIPVIPSLMAGCLTPSNVVKYPRASNHDAKNESFERDSMENGSKTPSPSSVASVDSNSSVRVDMTGECLTTASPDPTAAANA
jgi:dimethylaniline monooxygenase (N-oxide forming)